MFNTSYLTTIITFSLSFRVWIVAQIVLFHFIRAALVITFIFLYFRFLLEGGASRNILTDQGERPIDLVDPGDARMIQVMLSPLEKKR